MEETSDFTKAPLTELLRDRKIFAVFDQEFSRGRWLDVTALLNSESSITDLYEDGTVPAEVLDRIVERISSMTVPE